MSGYFLQFSLLVCVDLASLDRRAAIAGQRLIFPSGVTMLHRTSNRTDQYIIMFLVHFPRFAELSVGHL